IAQPAPSPLPTVSPSPFMEKGGPPQAGRDEVAAVRGIVPWHLGSRGRAQGPPLRCFDAAEVRDRPDGAASTSHRRPLLHSWRRVARRRRVGMRLQLWTRLYRGAGFARAGKRPALTVL